ncbi:MAG TPA: hypothetical protein VLV16_13530 [Gemmatimonadales bacterium]|nr:hypothetical protein [Gemmatimonadales bacterium]
MKHRTLAWWEEAVIALSAWISVFAATMATAGRRRKSTRSAG